MDKTNKLPCLDILINNTGIQTITFQTSYGTEHTLVINIIGTFLLVLQLISKLKETAKIFGVTLHMIFVGSALYDVAKYPENHRNDIFAWCSEKSHINIMDQ